VPHVERDEERGFDLRKKSWTINAFSWRGSFTREREK